MSVRPLTVKERILLHLFDYNRFAEVYEVPADVTQAKIAEAVGVHLRHLGQYLNPLVSEELVEERKSHVQKRRQKLKAYFLTGKGRMRAASQRNDLLRETVPFRTAGGDVADVPLARVYQEDRRGATLLELISEAQSLGYIPAGAGVAEGGFLDFTEDAPRIERFYGRDREVKEVSAALDGKPFVVVTGMAGMGKSTLGSKVCESLRGRRHLLWHNVRSWNTALDLVSPLALFLKSQGRVELATALAGQRPVDLGRLKDLLAADLSGGAALLVFDDVHNASAEVKTFLSILHRALDGQNGCSALLLSRTVPDFYSRRDVAVDASVVEFPLRGLDRESSVSLLSDAGIADPLLGSLVEACGGSPLFLKLLASAGPASAPEASWRTVETYISEEIDPGLDDAERGCLEVASLYQIPAPSDGLLLEGNARRSSLVGLQRKGLLDQVESDRFVLHDTIRTYFQQGLSVERRKVLVDKVVPRLLDEAERLARQGRPQDAISYLGNAVAVEVDAARKLSNLQRLGDLRRSAGDYPGAMEAYRTAMRGGLEDTVFARLHQKVAMCLEVQGHLDASDGEIERGLSRLPSEPSLEAGWLLYQRASVAYSRQDYETALREIDRVTGWMTGRPKDPDLWGWLTNLRGLIHLYDAKRFDPALAESDFREAIQAWEVVGERRGLCLAYNNLALASIGMGRGDEALAHLDRSAEIAEEVGDVPARTKALHTKAWYLSECKGEYDAAEALYQETYRLAKETHQRPLMIWHYRHFADLYRRQGRSEEARESQEYFLQASGDMLNPQSRIEETAFLSRLCVLCGDPDASEAWLSKADVLARGAAAGTDAQAVDWARAALLAARGNRRGAEAAYRSVMTSPVLERNGEFLLEHGRFLASIGKRDRAREVLREARDALRRDSLQPLERAAADMLESLGSRSGS